MKKLIPSVLCCLFKAMERWDLQKIFAKLNPDFNERTLEIAPDGDVQLTEDQIRDFQVTLIAAFRRNVFTGVCSQGGSPCNVTTISDPPYLNSGAPFMRATHRDHLYSGEPYRGRGGGSIQ